MSYDRQGLFHRGLAARWRSDLPGTRHRKSSSSQAPWRPYLHLVLADRTGELDAKAWDNVQETAALFERDDIVKVRGTIELYYDRPQLIVQRLRRCEEGEFLEADFCPVSARDPEEMFQELQAFVQSVGNDHLRGLLQSVLDDLAVATAIRIAPGAMRIHHPCPGRPSLPCDLCVQPGREARRALPTAQSGLADRGSHPSRHRQDRRAGHLTRLGYTTRGQLVGHVALGLEILDRHVSRLDGFPLDLKSLLQHLIVSHHGEIDKGALRQPAFPEAFVLHYLDEIDARLEQAWRLIDQGPDGEDEPRMCLRLGAIISTVSAGTRSRPAALGRGRGPFGIVASRSEPVVGSNGQR